MEDITFEKFGDLEKHRGLSLDEKLRKYEQYADQLLRQAKRRAAAIGLPDERDDPYGWKKFLKPLSKGIVGEDEKASSSKGKKRKKDDRGEAAKAGCEGPINVWHDELGRFSKKKDARSYSTGYEGDPAVTNLKCKPGKFKTKGGKSKQITRHPSGKKPDQTKHQYKVSTGQRVTEDRMSVDSAYLRAIIKDELGQALERSAKRGGCSFPQLLKAMSLWSAAEKGELSKEGD